MKASKLLLALLVLLWPTGAWAHSFDGPVPTPVWVDFWGQLTFKGEPAEPGDQVAVFDPQGVCCGVATVTEESAAGGSLYPFIHVYGDDSTTAAVDEGAVTNDLLKWMVYRASEDRRYGASVRLDVQDEGAPDPPRWVPPNPPLSAWHVDVEVINLFWEMPNQNVPFGGQFEPLDLNSFVAEPSNVGLVTWSAEAAGPDLTASISEGHILVVAAPSGWSGSELVTVTGECEGETTSQDVTFTVGENHAPVLGPMPGQQEVSEGETLTLELEATDPDGNAVTFSLSPEVDNAWLVPLPPSGGKQRTQLVFRPDFDQAGDYEFTITASDGYLSGEDTVAVTVNDTAGADVVFFQDLEPGQGYDLTIAGTGTLLDGFRIIIPAEALPYPVRLSVSLIDGSLLPPLPEGAFGFPFHVGPDGLVFNVPVTIIAPYGSTDPTGDVLAVYRCGEGVAGWSTEHISDVSCDKGEKKVTFKTTRFSSFTPAATNSVTPELSNDGGGGGGCFIATAAFGSPLEKHVAQLRLFRDRRLLSCLPGRLLVAAYYRWSPPAADFICRHPQFKGPVRAMLYPLAGLSALLLAPLTLQFSLLSLVLIIGAALAVARRRSR
jgi:hypothetical protein